MPKWKGVWLKRCRRCKKKFKIAKTLEESFERVSPSTASSAAVTSARRSPSDTGSPNNACGGNSMKSKRPPGPRPTVDEKAMAWALECEYQDAYDKLPSSTEDRPAACWLAVAKYVLTLKSR